MTMFYEVIQREPEKKKGYEDKVEIESGEKKWRANS